MIWLRMIIKKFEYIIAWKKAQDFAVEIYADFEKLRDASFRTQICSAVISISNNIAKVIDRSSDAEFVRFLYIALGSAGEVKSMLGLAEKPGCLQEFKRDELINFNDEISKIIRGFLKSIRQRNKIKNPLNSI